MEWEELEVLYDWASRAETDALHLQDGKPPLLYIQGRLVAVQAPHLPPGLVGRLRCYAGRSISLGGEHLRVDVAVPFCQGGVRQIRPPV